MNFTGLYLGLFMLFCIGFGFFWVIKLEYYLGAGVWKAVLGIGLLLCLASLFMPSFIASALLGIFGGSVAWGATELPAQEERARRGLFPKNPKRKGMDGGYGPSAALPGAAGGEPAMSLQWAGIVLALVTFAGIALGHVLVRRLHARFGTRPAIPLLVLGGLGLLLATVVLDDLLSGALGIAAVTVLWDGIEIYRQEKRTKK